MPADAAKYLLSIADKGSRNFDVMGFTSRVFQNLTIPDIIKEVVNNAELGEFVRYELKTDDIKYPKREFCVQYRETDFAFISRLMEECGIWYYIANAQKRSTARLQPPCPRGPA